MTPEEEILKGERAKSLYNEFMTEYFETMDQSLFEVFKSAEDDELAEIRRQSRTLDSMKAHLLHYIETGKIAKYQLED